MAEFFYRGRKVEDISREEFIELLPSKERRKFRRGLTQQEENFLEKLKKKDKNSFIKTHCRDIIILPEMVGYKIGIYNGKEFVPVEIKREMVGHRLGEFALTRKVIQHSSPGIGASRGTKFSGRK
ncbi:MAG: 30S ribosomal protein S19 [Candidatus Aenigmarchaeota archaeon ex4484_56]|nr:MAG: 30S ribosomal protein S19 [Candidatus Aenigmarchaeota archaeon ex4484_56]